MKRRHPINEHLDDYAPHECVIKADTSVILAVCLTLLLRLTFLNPGGELLRSGCGWLGATMSWCSFSLEGGTRPGYLEEQLAIRTNNDSTIARGTSDLPLSNARDNILFAGDHKNVIRQTSFRKPIFISHGSNEDVTSSRTSGKFR
jgi:hypothetical protein